MQFVFINMAGETLFIRDDAERAIWTQEEMTLEAEFTYLDNKRISIGQRIYFKDPSTGTPQIYEVKQANTHEPDHYQSIIAENICISELSDEHLDNKEITNKSAKSALQTVLSGTLWSVGTVGVNPTSSVDISRGSVWQAVLQIKDNWGVYIEPRVSLNSDGTITRRLDIISTDGVWNGVRLSIDKNMLDPSVIYDDSEVATALYGYGGTIIAEEQGKDDTEVNFANVVWSSTSEHPAKPSGQKYIEDPEATVAFGRNGRARFGFFQNTDITDPELLLQKTWETLKTTSKPSISIEGTVADLYRMGYADQPLKLHDIALVEVLPAGYKDQIQIIRMATDLLDPSATTLTIGAYIPNIVYIERKTNENVTGSRGGGGGNKSKQTERSEYETAIEKSNRKISLRAYQNDLDDLDNEVKLQEARIDVEHDRITMEVTDRRNADGVLSSKITQTATEIRAEVKNEVSGLKSTISQTASQIRAEVRNTASGLRSTITQTATSIRSEVTNAVSGLYSSITQTASQIRSELTNAVSGLSSTITQTASQIRSEVSNAVSGLNSTITQTASQIRSEVNNAVSGLQSSITQTASQIRSEVNNSISGVNSSITQTASQIRSEVSSSVSGLQSQITQNADNISLKVSKNGVISSINQSAESITISASKVNLNGYVTSSMLESAFTSAQQIATEQLTVSNYFTCLGYNVSWKSYSARWCSLSGEHTFKDTSGTSYTGRLVTDYSGTTLYYLGR